MPTVTTRPVSAFAHCENARCPGNEQQPVDGTVEHVAFSFKDLEGDMPGVERSTEHVRFADSAERDCSYCGRARAITLQQRPVYDSLSGHAQDGLLRYKSADGRLVAPPSESVEVGELKAQVAQLTDMVTKLTASKPSKGA